MTRALVAWMAFAAGVLFLGVDVVRLTITGLALLGATLLVIWLWGIGGLRRGFWVRTIDDSHPDALGSLDLRDRAGRLPHVPPGAAVLPDATTSSAAASPTDATS